MKCTAIIKDKLKWFKTAAGIVSSILIGISFFLLFIAYLLNKEYLANTVNIIVCISTNLLGIIVTVSFVQFFFNKQDAKNCCLEEKNKIMRYHTVLQILIQRYCMFYSSVTTPISDRNVTHPQLTLLKDFKFEDMRDLYKSSAYITDGILTPSIELFYKAEEQLRNFIIMMCNNIDFKYYPNISKCFLSFISSSLSMDVRGTVLGNVNIFSENKRISECAVQMIKENTQEDWVTKFDSGKLTGNLIVPYIILYKLLNIEKKLIIDYLNQIKIITKTK